MTTRRPVPARIRTAVNLLEVGPDQHLLEIGGGRGVAADLVCARLTTGRYVGIDRSPVAVRAAREHNGDHVRSGRARFEQHALAETDPAELGRFDAVFAINVNLFWTGPARRELDVVRRLLRPSGRLWLFYQTPAGPVRVSGPLREHLTRAGFTPAINVADDLLVCLSRPVPADGDRP